MEKPTEPLSFEGFSAARRRNQSAEATRAAQRAALEAEGGAAPADGVSPAAAGAWRRICLARSHGSDD